LKIYIFTFLANEAKTINTWYKYQIFIFYQKIEVEIVKRFSKLLKINLLKINILNLIDNEVIVNYLASLILIWGNK
jgi:hypothetical protein